jgi:hypothetical protein
MQTFVILRRGGWTSAEDIAEAAKRSTAAMADMDGSVRWLRSYVLSEPEGRLGTVCVYQAADVDVVRRHARAADLPVDEIIPVAEMVVVEADPT